MAWSPRAAWSDEMLLRILIVITLSLLSNYCLAFEKAFYAMRNDYSSVVQHISAIDILMPQGYIVKPDGTVKGEVNAQLITESQQKHFKLMPMVTNAGFDQKALHKFLKNSVAKRKVIEFLVNASKNNHLYGVQIDFENIAFADQKNFTQFYQNLSQQLHQQGFAISVAIVPRQSDYSGESAYQKSKYQNWRGAYDYRALANASNFVTLMTYDQHEGATTPGPIAAIPWVEASIHYALKYIPKDKISLGIPTYSGHWVTTRSGKHISSMGYQIVYTSLCDLLKKYSVKLNWDEHGKIYYAFFDRNELNEFIFAENVYTFQEKLGLIKKYNLRGMSMWRLGAEDPAIWKYIK